MMLLGFYRGKPITTGMCVDITADEWLDIYCAYLCDGSDRFRELCNKYKVDEIYALWTCEQADRDLKPNRNYLKEIGQEDFKIYD